MPSMKPRFTITMNDELFKKIDDFRFEKKMRSQTEAVTTLIRIGLDTIYSGQNDEIENVDNHEHDSYTVKEEEVIAAYRRKTEMQSAIDKLLEVEIEETVELPMVARSRDGKFRKQGNLTHSELERVRSAQEPNKI